MKTIILWQSIVDPSIEVESSAEALQLNQENPGDPKYLDWIQVLRVVNDAG